MQHVPSLTPSSTCAGASRRQADRSRRGLAASLTTSDTVPPAMPQGCGHRCVVTAAQPRWAVCATGAGAHQGQTSREGESTYGGRPGQRVEEQGTWASQKHSEAGYGRPVDRGVWTAKTLKRPRQQPAHPEYANYWAPLTRKRHTMPHSAQSQHTKYWAPQTRKRHQQEQRPQRPTERSDPTQHAKGRTGDCPGPRKGATTRRNVTRGGGGGLLPPPEPHVPHRRWSHCAAAPLFGWKRKPGGVTSLHFATEMRTDVCWSDKRGLPGPREVVQRPYTAGGGGGGTRPLSGPPPPPDHNHGTELAMKVVRQARLEHSGGSTPDLLRPRPNLPLGNLVGPFLVHKLLGPRPPPPPSPSFRLFNPRPQHGPTRSGRMGPAPSATREGGDL